MKPTHYLIAAAGAFAAYEIWLYLKGGAAPQIGYGPGYAPSYPGYPGSGGTPGANPAAAPTPPAPPPGIPTDRGLTFPPTSGQIKLAGILGLGSAIKVPVVANPKLAGISSKLVSLQPAPNQGSTVVQPVSAPPIAYPWASLRGKSADTLDASTYILFRKPASAPDDTYTGPSTLAQVMAFIDSQVRWEISTFNASSSNYDQLYKYGIPGGHVNGYLKWWAFYFDGDRGPKISPPSIITGEGTLGVLRQA